MSEIKLITKDTVIPKLKPMDWDVEINGRPYYVVRIEGYVHSIGGRWGENDLWAYPRGTEPSYNNLIEFSCDHPVLWGLEFHPVNSSKTKWDETEARSHSYTRITRNGKTFCDVPGAMCYSLPKAQMMIVEAEEHPAELNSIDFDQKLVGRKIFWRSEPAIIERYIHGQACVVFKPDGIDHFTTPAEFACEDPDYYEDDEVKTSIFDEHIWWFREDKKE